MTLAITRRGTVAYGPYARIHAVEPIPPPPAATACDAPQRRPHQIRALDAITTAIGNGGRAQLHWACGTGKTLVGRWLAEDLDVDRALVVAPSLALTAQTLAEWQGAGPWPFRAMVVCSDPSTGDAWRVDAGWWSQHGVRVTTDASEVARFLAGDSDLPRIVFSTYHSAPVVAEATHRARAGFDVMICDEAHRLAGTSDERFRVVLDDGELPATRRLFATATPVYTSERASSTALSMADTSVFGPVVDRLDFADAIAAGLLVDYQVVVLDDAGDVDRLTVGTAVPAALAAAADANLTRVISFHSRVVRARRFAADVDGLQLPDGRTVRASAVAGADPTAQRRAALDGLAHSGPSDLTLVANARCLTEGVDVPAVDGIIFADPKTSDTDIIQAIGRGLRPAPGKTRGLIILPVVVADGGDSEQLFAGNFAAVWGVLRALRAMDPRMAAAIDEARRHPQPAGVQAAGHRHPLLRFDVSGVDLRSFAARFVDETDVDDSFAEMAGLLRDWIETNGHAAIAWQATVNGKPLGRWANTQRRVFAVDALPADRVEALEAIPGWAWTWDGAWWQADFAAVARVAASYTSLDLTDPDIAGIRLRHRGRTSLTVGRWCAQQRRDGRDGYLTDWQVEQCESIHSWSWDAGVDERDRQMVDALAEWVDKHQDANVPADTRWGNAPLGAFIVAVRRRAVTGRLQSPLADDITVVTPGRQHNGAFEWRADETRWDLHLMALAQFAHRTGGCRIPEHGIEEMSGYSFLIYSWSTRQRHLYRHGNLDPARAAALEQVPGWDWERERAVRVTVGIGARQHGTRLGYAAGCLCEECTAANTTYEADRQRRRAAGEATTDLVDAAAARGHLRVLEGRIGKRARPAVQQITGLNKKTVDECINGTAKRLHPETSDALLALTVDRIHEHIAANPSTRDAMPAEPTMRLVDDLVSRGWPKSWISREIGGNGTSLQIGRTGTGLVRRETADAIAALHAAVGNRLPSRQWRSGLPALAELIAAESSATPNLHHPASDPKARR